MKTMTEFIMEQEAPQVVEESFNEADLVSQFMALQAASANLSCVMEFAAIAEFCNENEINMPESLVQEGFADVMDKVFEAISNFFQKIADWFKSLVKGASAAFSKSKITELIAKLKSAKFADAANVPEDIAKNLKYINATYKIVWNFFVEFKTVLVDYKDTIKDAQELTTPDDDKYKNFISNLDSYNENLEVFKTESKWYRPGDGSVDLNAFKGINTTNVSEAEYKTLSVENATKILENINKFNIPKQSGDLLKALDVADKEFAAIGKIDAHKDEKGQDVPEKTVYSKDANLMRDIKKKIETCSKLLANAYDKVTGKLVALYGKEFKDIEAPANDKDSKEKYNKQIEAAKKASGSGVLSGKDVETI